MTAVLGRMEEIKATHYGKKKKRSKITRNLLERKIRTLVRIEEDEMKEEDMY